MIRLLMLFVSVAFLVACANQEPVPLRSDRVWGIFPNLEQTDRDMMQRLAREELTGKPPGTELRWSNPDSGAHGTVKLLNTSVRDGMHCRDVQHVVETRVDLPESYIFKLCEQSAGQWKVVDLRKLDLDQP